MNASQLPPEKQSTSFVDLWDVIRSCELNVVFHRERARRTSRLAKQIDICAGLLAAAAGVGILSGISRVPGWVWAALAFISGFLGQFRSVLGLPDLELQHRKLQNDYGSVLSLLKGIVDRAKDAGGLTYELDVQRQLILERFHFAMERDDTDYDSKELSSIQEKINQMYPPNRLWMPPGSTPMQRD